MITQSPEVTHIKVNLDPKQKETNEQTTIRVRRYLADMVLDGKDPRGAYVSPHIERINNKEPYIPVGDTVNFDHPWLSGEQPTPKEVYDLMISSRSREEWSNNRKTVFEIFDGKPEFWDLIVKNRELFKEVSKHWEK